ncbi:hypothetical protein QL285_074790 [Trifolium repens]|nr:hypothetical protein QL285_074790 [Trifolium repens]
MDASKKPRRLVREPAGQNPREGRVHTKRPMGNKMHFSSSENASKALFLFWKLLLKAPRSWKLLLKAPRNRWKLK